LNADTSGTGTFQLAVCLREGTAARATALAFASPALIIFPTWTAEILNVGSVFAGGNTAGELEYFGY
jgi:hypothetical protein